MMRLVPFVAVASAALAFVLPANADREYTATQAAFSAASDYLAPLTRSDVKAVKVNVVRCRDLGRWHGCRVRVAGMSSCNAIMRVRVVGGEYVAWMPRARCR